MKSREVEPDSQESWGDEEQGGGTGLSRVLGR